MPERPRWLDMLFAILLVGLLVANVFLFEENRELRRAQRDRKLQLEKLKDWHIHVSSELSARGLDVEPVFTAEDLENDHAERRRQPREEAPQ